MIVSWRLVAATLGIVAACVLAERAISDVPSSAGESIYLHGVLSSGAPLTGTRDSAETSAQGADAACVNCHLRSGLGAREGKLFIPPVTGDYLFHGHAHGGDEPVLPYVESMHGNRSAYTPVTLARAIREGIDPDGRTLSTLMPRFAIDDADMAALTDYLNGLSVHRVPGVTSGELHFATIFTPDADPVKRAGVLDVLQRYIAELNSFPLGPSPRMWTSGKTAYAKSMYMAHLRWRLHVWQLTGPASSWRGQLEQHLAQEPVFAVLSGLGGTNWAPVHEFCESNAVPCIFPNVEVPVVEQDGFYSLYYSKGVLLEAGLIANRLAAGDPDPGLVVDQVYRHGDSGEAAAGALAATLKSRGITVRDHALPAGARGRGLGGVLRATAKSRVLVLWLRGSDIAALGSPPAQAKVYISGLMAGLEDAPLPASWRERSFITFPLDVPDKRGIRLDYPLGWFSFRHMPVVALQVQVDTYLACSIVSEVLKQLADSYVRPYFIEQIQSMLEHRLITGYYPHLTLGYHERFASKGGYIAHFAPAGARERVVADGDWIVP